MKKVDYWRWRLKSETHAGKTYNSRHLMTEAEALARDPNAVRITGSHSVIEVAETAQEIAARAPSNQRLR